MVENVCTQLKLCIQLDKTPDSLNIKFDRLAFNITDIITDIKFFL